ncbi:MAG: hypothetical protein M3O50_12015, partial [Myxococcota bacterium]|nr:hypothetical protein [Myxococcota bacterium]
HVPVRVGPVSNPTVGEVDASTAGLLASNRQRAGGLRQEATVACGLARWTTCANKLDEAQKLDPPGEGDPSVKKLRQALDSVRAPVPHGTKGGD